MELFRLAVHFRWIYEIRFRLSALYVASTFSDGKQSTKNKICIQLLVQPTLKRRGFFAANHNIFVEGRLQY